jgi:hypothetical protein
MDGIIKNIGASRNRPVTTGQELKLVTCRWRQKES